MISSLLSRFLLFLILPSLLLSTPFNCTPPNSTNSTDPTICLLINQTLNLTDQTTTLNYTSLTIQNSTLFCDTKVLYTQCLIEINATQVTFLNSSLRFAIIHINASSLSLTNSNLSTNGTIKYGYGRPNECANASNDVGFGFAGSGAYCQDLYSNCGKPYGAVDLLLNKTDDPQKCLGTGSGQFIADFYGCGGGRVNINTNTMTLKGNSIISASGSPQKEPEYDCTKRTSKPQDILNGGTGGYIFLGVNGAVSYSNATTDIIKLIAEGGNYCDGIDQKSTKFAGSGGRIIIDIDPAFIGVLQYFMKGGINDLSVKTPNINPCRNGASGSLYFYRNNTVVFSNDGFAASTITQIPANQSFTKILVTNGARAGPDSDNLLGTITANAISIQRAYLAYERFHFQLSIQCQTLSILGTKDNLGGIGPPEQNSKSTSLNITAVLVEFSNNTMIQFGKEFNLSCQIATLNGSIQSYFFDSGFYLNADHINMLETQIEVSMIAIATSNELLIKNSRLKAFKQKCKDQNITYPNYVNLLDYDLNLLNLPGQNSNLDALHYLLAVNYTFLIVTPKNITLSVENTTDPTKGLVQGANLAIFATNINITSRFFVSSEDLGCSNEQGLGKGTQDPNLGNKCGGTGGSYGGFGSLAWSNYTDILKDCLKIKSPSIYGDIFSPIYEGSGGGGNQERLNPGGKGGGVIIIAAASNLTINGNVSSSGSSPETQMGKATAGSGSGGSIQLFMENLSGAGTVKSEGGSTQSSGIGGPGGGGRIRANFRYWYREKFYSESWMGRFSVSQGKRSDFITLLDDASDIMGKGTLSTTPCMPGHYGEVCGLCEKGKYKNIVGFGGCFDCLNKPENAYYSVEGETNPQCSFQCNSNITSGNLVDTNPNCYAPFYFYINKMGGYPGIIGIALVLIIILIVVLIRFAKKKKRVFRESVDRNQHLFDDINMEKGAFKKELAKVGFCMEDMPYHLKRIYLVGENNHRNPWYINKNECLDITHHEIDIIKLDTFREAVNQKFKFNSLITCFLVLIRWLYYPLYYLLIHLFRHRKHKMMLNSLPDFKILYRNQDSLDMSLPLLLKFSTTPDLTLGYIDILNYNKSVLEWSSMKFPICLILAGEGSFLFPLYLSQHDPLVKTLGTIINEEGQNDEKEIWDVEKLESNEVDAPQEKVVKKRKINFQDFLKGFNETARKIDYWCSFGDFMKCVMELLDYVDKHNSDYFKQKSMRAEVFLHQIADDQENKDPRQQTTIIFLDKGSKPELEKSLKEAQKCKHYNHSYDVKFSLNLIRNEEISQRNSSITRNEANFEFQVKRPVQIEDKKTENSEEDMDYLKKKLLSRLENSSPEVQKMREDPDINKWDFLKEEWPQNLRAWFDKVERGWGYFRAFFLRFRSSKENSSLLPVALFFFLIVDLMVLLIIIVITIGDSFSNKAGLVYVYPFSVVISTGLFVVWFGCFQNNILLGRLFLIYNAQSMLNMIVGFIVALTAENQMEIVVNLLFTIEKFIILYVGSKYLSLK